MVTVQVVLEQELLRAADRAARRFKVNRSALIREALREHLKRIRIREKEQRDREGYRRFPETAEELELWEKAAAWPEE